MTFHANDQSAESAIAQPTQANPLRTEAAAILSSNPANDATNSQQAMELLQQGLKDVSPGQNEVYGILELMKGASVKPDLVQDERFLESLKTAVGDTHTHAHVYPLDAQQMQAVTAAEGQSQPDGSPAPELQPQQTAASGNDMPAQASPAGPGDVGTSNVSAQLIQQGLTAIAAGDKMNGIMALMQAAQLNPSIVQDSRFVSALQNALSQASPQQQPGNASLNRSPEAQTEQTTNSYRPEVMPTS